MIKMKKVGLSAVIGCLALYAHARSAPALPGADPYVGNAHAGTQTFSLAAPAGKDRGAMKIPLPGGVNKGPIDPGIWKFGPQNQPPVGSKIWSPVKAKMLQGGKVTGGTLFASTDHAVYCAVANAGYDFI